MGASYLPDRDADGNIINKNEAFATKAGHSFKGTGVEQNCTANGETNIDLAVDDTYDLSGIEILGARLGDEVQLKVLDTATGTYSGIPDYMLDQFGINWKIRPDFVKQMPYTARVMNGMVLRVVYNNKDTADRMIYVNYDLHKVVT